MAIGSILGGLGAVGGFLSGRSAQKSQKELSRAQRRIADTQLQQYQATLPFYNAMLGQYARSMGLDVPLAGGQPGAQQPSIAQPMPSPVRALPQRQTVTGMMPAAPPAAPATGVPVGTYQGQQTPLFGSRRTMAGVTQPMAAGPEMGANFGTPEDQLRLARAEEDINRNTNAAMNRLRFQFNRIGLADASQAGALANVGRLGAQDYANFRRNLAIQAPEVQAQRFAQFANFLNPGMGSGMAAAGIFGSQAAQMGQQAQQGFGAVGQFAQQLGQQDALRRYMQQYGGAPPVEVLGPVSTPPWMMAQTPEDGYWPY